MLTYSLACFSLSIPSLCSYCHVQDRKKRRNETVFRKKVHALIGRTKGEIHHSFFPERRFICYYISAWPFFMCSIFPPSTLLSVCLARIGIGRKRIYYCLFGFFTKNHFFPFRFPFRFAIAYLLGLDQMQSIEKRRRTVSRKCRYRTGSEPSYLRVVPFLGNNYQAIMRYLATIFAEMCAYRIPLECGTQLEINCFCRFLWKFQEKNAIVDLFCCIRPIKVHDIEMWQRKIRTRNHGINEKICAHMHDRNMLCCFTFINSNGKIVPVAAK